VSIRTGLLLFVFIAILQLVAAVVSPPFGDELYYWAWSRQLQWSYHDHPLMVALLIRLSSAVFGNTLLGVRFFACVSTWVCVYCIARLSRDRSAVAWLFLTPLFLLGALVMTPDAPLLAFWAAYLFWTAHQLRAFQRDDSVTRLRWGWAAGGVLLGLGVLSKYTMALAAPCGLLAWLGEYRHWRRWWAGYILHGVVAFVVASPILIYNLQTDFAPLRFQWEHVNRGDGFSPGLVLGLYAVQIALVGTLPVLAWPWMVRHLKSMWSSPRLRACLCFYLFPMAFFFVKACQNRLEANWLLVAYVAPWPLALYLQRVVRVPIFQPRWYRLAFVIPGICCLLVVIHSLAPFPWIAASNDRLARRGGQAAVAEEVARYVRDLEHPPVVLACTYQWTAELRFAGAPAMQIPEISGESFFTLTQPKIPGGSALVFLDRPNPALLRRWASHHVLREFPLLVRGQEVARCQLVECWSNQ